MDGNGFPYTLSYLSSSNKKMVFDTAQMLTGEKTEKNCHDSRSADGATANPADGNTSMLGGFTGPVPGCSIHF